MSIDPNTLPDGTVVETSDGVLRFKDRAGWQINRAHLGDNDRFSWGGRTIVRTYTPDPTPDQEVPRDEWANIAVGSRVRIVEANGDEHTVTLDYVTDEPWLWTTEYGYDGAKVARVYLLDAPTPPDRDAEAVEVMARAEADADSMPPWHCDDDPNRPAYLRRARAALAALREHEATR